MAPRVMSTIIFSPFFTSISVFCFVALPPLKDIFDRIEGSISEITIAVPDLNDICIDALMYENTALVQSVLDTLVTQYSSRSILLDNACSTQLLVQGKRERQFNAIDKMLHRLQSNAETQELWGNLETKEDMETNRATHEILILLIDTCRSRRFVLEFNEEYLPERDVQDLLRNLGFFDVAFEVYNLLESIEEDEEGNIGPAGENIVQLVLLCNQVKNA